MGYSLLFKRLSILTIRAFSDLTIKFPLLSKVNMRSTIYLSDTDWDFYWCDVGWLRENFDHMFMEEHVRICHFRNHYEVQIKYY